MSLTTLEPAPRRIGVVGLGTIGSHLVERLRSEDDPGLCLAFAHSRSGIAPDGLDPALFLADLAEAPARRPDLIVEAAHPEVTRHHGVSFLRVTDYLTLSTTVLADDELRTTLEATAAAAGTRLWLARGALVGTPALVDWRDLWDRVTIQMDKPPAGIDFGASGLDGRAIAGRTTLYRGPVRGIAARFPRNVNAMVTLALATVGLDRTRGVLIADPALTEARLLITAVGRDGSRLRIERRQPLIGVSGTEMAASAWSSVRAAAGQPQTSGIV